MSSGSSLQRLFSTFPDGWPGLGLLVLRAGAAVPLLWSGAGLLNGFANPVTAVQTLIEAGGGILLLAGLWTPVIGSVVAADEAWMAASAFSTHADIPWMHILLAVIAAAVAMLGPGAWSVDSRLFGRLVFETNGRQRKR